MLPIKFLERLDGILSETDRSSTLEAMQSTQATGFRVNTLRSSVSAVKARLESLNLMLHPVEWYGEAFWVAPNQRDALMASQDYTDRNIYLQNLSSMIPPLVLEPQPGERILDLTAAPGSKTLQIACLTGQDGELAAVEVVKSRFFKMRENLLSHGATDVKTFLKDGQRVWRHRPEYFDRVLLDAPCSSEGRFRIDEPESYAYWSERKIKEMVRKQKKLLFSAIQSLRPGGTLVYSTCSLAPEENEGVVTRMLKRFDGAIETAPLSISIEAMRPALESWNGKKFDPQLIHARRILPSYLTEGFFVCKMVKIGH